MKAIFAIAILAIFIYLGVMLLPPYFNNYQLQDDITNIARYATYAQAKTAEEVRSDVIAKAKEEGVALTEENVTVSKDNVGVSIDVKYTITVPVPGYTFKLKFNPTAGNRQITAK